MKTIEVLKNRRTYYDMDDNIDVSDEKIVETVEEVARLVPDAFDMKSQRLVILQGAKHKELWDNIFDVFQGMVAREKIDTFKNAAGTILYFYDKKLIEKMKEDYKLYENHFEGWAYQANGMLQLSVWNALEEMGLGVNLQHYNPVIDEKVKEMCGIDEDYILLAQMVYGNKLSNVEEKEKEDIKQRVKVIK